MALISLIQNLKTNEQQMKWITLSYWHQLQATNKKLESSEIKELLYAKIKLFWVSKKMTQAALWI